jgi:Domain of unknown function (DUF1854)
MSEIQTPLDIRRDAFGKLLFIDAQGVTHEGVVPVRAFPIAAPDEGISLVSIDGHELAWIDSLQQLPAAQRCLIEDELRNREFMPEIHSIRKVSSFATPSEWSVETDRGDTRFILRGEEDIRRVADGTLLIADSHGVQFLIRNRYSMDRVSRRILDRFL